MRHVDVVKKIMLAQLARTLTEWHCNPFTDLIDVGLERSKQRLVVAIGKVVAHSKSVSHMARQNLKKNRVSARP